MNDVALLKSPLQGHFFFNLSVFSGCLLTQLKENHLKKLRSMGRNPGILCLGNFCIRLYSAAEKNPVKFMLFFL